MNSAVSKTSYFTDYYSMKLENHAPTSAEAVGWSEYLQLRLFDHLTQIIKERDHCSILDVGCGLGHMAGYLADHGYCTYDYSGIDIVKGMIRKAENLYPDHLFLVGDFLHYPFFRKYDYVFSSGTLNILIDHPYSSQEEFLSAFIEKLFRLGEKGCAFNMLSAAGRDFFPENNYFYYADPRFIEKISATLCRNVNIIQDDNDFTFTVHLTR